MSEVLQAKGYSVVEVINAEELREKAMSVVPYMIVANANLWESEVVKTLQFEKGLENVFFILLADNQTSSEKINFYYFKRILTKKGIPWLILLRTSVKY